MDKYCFMWNDLKKRTIKEKEAYDDGRMMSMHESIYGSGMCEIFLKLMGEIEKEYSDKK